MLKPLMFATLAAIGNGLFVYGQRGAAAPTNPFLFVLGAMLVGAVFIGLGAIIYRSGDEVAYLAAEWWLVVVSGAGYAVTFIGFFLLYNNFGAAQYTLYAVVSILTTSLVVGVLIYKEDFNLYHAAAVVLAIAAIALFTYGNSHSEG